jgi:hypothetical protein
MRITTSVDGYGNMCATVNGIDMYGPCVIDKYRTNKYGKGLWIWDDFIRDWRQIAGTCQFSARDRAALRRKLRRMLT